LCYNNGALSNQSRKDTFVRRFARLAPFIVLLFLVFMPLRLVATTRVAPVIDPSGQGKPLLTPTISVIKCGVPVPVDAILARNTVYPDPATCNHDPTGEELARRINWTGPNVIPPPDAGTKATPTTAPASTTPSHAFSAFSQMDSPAAQSSSPVMDQYNGFNVHPIALKVGLQTDASALIPNYYPFSSRWYGFLKPLVLPPGKSCVYATVYHERNNPTLGSVDTIAGEDICAHTGYAWSLHDSVAVAQLVRNDQYGNPIARIMAEQTSLLPSCFIARAYNFTYMSWTNIVSSCSATTSLNGGIALEAGSMEFPTPLYCPSANYNAYVTNALKKTDNTWANIPLSDLYAAYVGSCTTGHGGTWYAYKYLNAAGTTEVVFFQ
jgi:hypothetical protein